MPPGRGGGGGGRGNPSFGATALSCPHSTGWKHLARSRACVCLTLSGRTSRVDLGARVQGEVACSVCATPPLQRCLLPGVSGGQRRRRRDDGPGLLTHRALGPCILSVPCRLLPAGVETRASPHFVVCGDVYLPFPSPTSSPMLLLPSATLPALRPPESQRLRPPPAHPRPPPPTAPPGRVGWRGVTCCLGARTPRRAPSSAHTCRQPSFNPSDRGPPATSVPHTPRGPHTQPLFRPSAPVGS